MVPLRPTVSASPMMDSCPMRLPTRWVSQETIQSTAREASRRILFAERKAFRFQQDLAALKEESLKMMIRLKQKMDSKLAEAEKVTSVQSKRINELECQLMEAEDIVQSLRSELERVSGELYRRKKMLEVPDEQISEGSTGALQNACNDGKFKPLNSVSPQPEPLGISVPNDKDMNSRPCSVPQEGVSKGNFVHNPDLASIILTHKEMEPCRNGCTQRIRAFEHNLLAEHWTHPDANGNGLSILKNGFHVINASSAIQSEMDKQDITGTKNARPSWLKYMVHAKKDAQRDEGDKVFPDCFSRRRKMSNPLDQVLVLSDTAQLGENVSTDVKQLNNDSESKLQPISAETDKESCKEFRDYVVLSDDNCSMSSVRKAEVIQLASSNASIRAADFTVLNKDSEKSDEDASGCLYVHCQADGHDDGLSIPASNVKDRKESEFDENRQEYGLVAKGDIHNNTQGKEVLNSAKQEPEVPNYLGYTSMQENIIASETLFQVSDINEKHCESSTAPIRSIDDKLLKYTFQRKRKRELMCDKKENVIEDKQPCSKKRSPRRRRTLQTSSNSGLVMESSRHSRRLVQVARQLISLSGKRW